RKASLRRTHIDVWTFALELSSGIALRFRAQNPVRGSHVENFRFALHPRIVDRNAFEAPFLAVAHQLAIITVHQKRVLRTAARSFPRHEMLRQHIGIECGGVAADFDLKIARGVSSVERTEKRQQSVQDGLATSQLRKLDPES